MPHGSWPGPGYASSGGAGRIECPTTPERLFLRELNGESDTFFDALGGYAEVLGPEGLAAYRKLAEGEWERMAPRTRNADGYTFDNRRWRITHMMETLARVEGDVDALVAVIAQDLSHAYAYLLAEIARRLAIHPNTVKKWRNNGLLVGRLANDKGEYLYQLPGPDLTRPRTGRPPRQPSPTTTTETTAASTTGGAV